MSHNPSILINKYSSESKDRTKNLLATYGTFEVCARALPLAICNGHGRCRWLTVQFVPLKTEKSSRRNQYTSSDLIVQPRLSPLIEHSSSSTTIPLNYYSRVNRIVSLV